MTARRTFLKLIVSGAAIAALPALGKRPPLWTPAPDDALIGDLLGSSPEELLNAWLPSAVQLRVRLRVAGGAWQTLVFPLPAELWELGDGSVRFTESIRMRVDDACDVMPRLRVTDGDDRTLITVDLDGGPWHAEAGDEVRIAVPAIVLD